MSKGGRPTEYKEEYIDKVDEYLENHQDIIEVTYSESSGKAATYIKVKLPTVEGFARFIEVPKSTLYDWKAKHKEFSDSLEKILTEQQERLINQGLSGSYNPTIAKLILSANHGMREKTETDITSGGETITPIYGGLSRHTSNEEDIQSDQED